MKNVSGSCALHTVISASPPSTPHVAGSGTRICRGGASPARDARAAGAHGCALAGTFPRATCLRGRSRPHGGAPPAPPHLAHRHLLPSFHRLLDKPRAPPRRRQRSAPSLGSASPGRAGSERTGRGRRAELSAAALGRRGNWAVGEAAGLAFIAPPARPRKLYQRVSPLAADRAGGGGAARRWQR